MITEFFYAALPWVACGLIVAICAAASYRTVRKKRSDADDDASDNKQADNSMSVAFYTVAVISYVTSLFMLAGKHDGSYSSFTVWMAIGSMFMCIASVKRIKNK